MLPGMGGLAGAWGIARLLFGADTGDVLEWQSDSGWRALPESAGCAPNGIAASPDGSEIYVAEWGSDRLVRLRRDEQGQIRRDSVGLPHHPDNITWTRDGRLLVTGQVGPIGGLMTCNRIESGTCGMPFSVVLVEPATLEVVLVLESPSAVIGAGTVALEVGDEIFIGTFAGDRVARAPFHY
jgi:DNA-binding beta-propeller fold protein YncE